VPRSIRSRTRLATDRHVRNQLFPNVPKFAEVEQGLSYRVIEFAESSWFATTALALMTHPDV
jgi:hypothetical protein